MSLSSVASSILAALFPPRCGACDRELDAAPPRGLCAACDEVLEPNAGPRCRRCDLPGRELCAPCRGEPPPWERLRAPWIYGGGIAELVQRVKFHGREDLATALGRLLTGDAEVLELARACDAIAPVPLGKARVRSRGFNQAAVLARAVAAASGKPVRHVLRRTRETPPQSDLPLAARRHNMGGAFAATGRPPGAILLVDDVVTSGETMRQAAATLLGAGAPRIVVAAVARAI